MSPLLAKVARHVYTQSALAHVDSRLGLHFQGQLARARGIPPGRS